MADNAANRRTLESIQVLRGGAALLVVLYHFRSLLVFHGVQIGDLLFRNGFAGVDIFFVVSGFVIAYTTSDTTRPLVFLYRRAVRIIPLYFIGTLAAAYLEASPTDAILKSLFFIPLENSHQPFLGYAVLGVGWTLNYEAFFYLIFASTLVFGKWRLVVASGILTVLVFVTQGVAGQFSLNTYNAPILFTAYASMVTNPIMFEFCIGIALARAFQISLSLPKWVALLSSTGTFVIFVFTILMASRPGHGLTGVGIPATALVASLIALEREGGFHAPRFLLILGDASFALYLVHDFFGRLLPYSPNFLGTLGQFAVIVPLSIMGGLAVHHFVERPLILLLRSPFRAPSGLNATVESGNEFPWNSRRASLRDAHRDRRSSDS
jgi:exopolysaccharide production protein ExoZ